MKNPVIYKTIDDAKLGLGHFTEKVQKLHKIIPVIVKGKKVGYVLQIGGNPLVISPFTNRKYKGKISYSIDNEKTGTVWVDNRIIATYSDVKNIKELSDLFKQDYTIKKNPKRKGGLTIGKRGKYIREVLKTVKQIKKIAKPYTPIFRSKKMNSTVVTIAFWGKKIRGRHQYYTIQRILHKIGSKTRTARILGKTLKKGVIYKLPLTPAGRRISKSALKKFAATRKFKRRIIRVRQENPAYAKPVLIYDRVLQIRAQKGKDSHYAGKKFYHNFGKYKSSIYGMPDGSLLIKGSKRLWRKFKV